MKPRLFIPSVLLVLLAGLLMSAAANETTIERRPESMFDRLAVNDVARFELTFETDRLEEMKRTEDYFPATFTLNGEAWDAKVKVRGRFRRRVCEFPPLKLKLSKDMLAAAGLQPHNKFKLVTHCSDDFDTDDNILREQLAYDLYRTITGEGYRTQLVRVTYRNATTGEAVERFGILIEDTTEMAEANGGIECEDCYNLPQDQFVAGNVEQVALFQYMIGNTDYGVSMPRNIKLVQQQAGGQYKVVPYDFDFSGLVNSEYAIPKVEVNQTSVTQRVWMWDFTNSPDLTAATEQFLSKEAACLALITNNPHLSSRSKRQLTRYLSDFFIQLQEGRVAM